jgi:hypothetical protein
MAGRATVIAVALAGCTPFVPLSVHGTPPLAPSVPAPAVRFTAVVDEPDFIVFQAADGAERYYVVPQALHATATDGDRLLGVALAHWADPRVIVIVHLSPPAALLERARRVLADRGRTATSVAFYPVSTLSVALVTDPQDVSVLVATVVPGSGEASTFSALVALQSSYESVAAVTRLLQSPNGFIAQGLYTLPAIDEAGPAPRTLSVRLDLANVTLTGLTR